jgi:hypothetical protein
MNKRKTLEDYREAAKNKILRSRKWKKDLFNLNQISTEFIVKTFLVFKYEPIPFSKRLKRKTQNTYLEGIYNFLLLLDKEKLIDSEKTYPIENLFLPLATELAEFYCAYSVNQVLSGKDSESSVEKRIVGIAKFYEVRCFENPFITPNIRKILSKIRRPTKIPRINDIKELRDETILALHESGMTWKEIAQLDVEDLEKIKLGDTTNITVENYLSKVQLVTGPLFPSTSKKGRLIRHTRKGFPIEKGISAEALRKAARSAKSRKITK